MNAAGIYRFFFIIIQRSNMCWPHARSTEVTFFKLIYRSECVKYSKVAVSRGTFIQSDFTKLWQSKQTMAISFLFSLRDSSRTVMCEKRLAMLSSLLCQNWTKKSSAGFEQCYGYIHQSYECWFDSTAFIRKTVTKYSPSNAYYSQNWEFSPK